HGGPVVVGEAVPQLGHGLLARALPGGAALRLLRRERDLEAGLVDLDALLGGDEPRQIEREAVGVGQGEGDVAGDRAALAGAGEGLVEEPGAAVERAAEPL